MPSIQIIAVGRMKPAHLLRDPLDEYRKRIKWDLAVHEIDVRESGPRQNDLENQEIIARLRPQIPTFVLDERGKSITSPAFAQRLAHSFEIGQGSVQFVIGGADGLNDTIRARASDLISFGALTWPHMLARVMLMEQLYRAQQILAGHPYHRE